MPKIKWIPSKIQEEANKHQTRNSFKLACRSAYDAAKRQGILDEVCAHMPKRVDTSGKNSVCFKHEDELIYEEAKKYSSRCEFEKNSRWAYNTAKRRKILDEVCAHMDIIRKNWTIEEIHQKAKECSTRVEFKNRFSAAYSAASRAGVLDLVLSHTKSSTTSYPEKEIFNYIKSKFKDTKKLYDRKRTMKERPHIKGFDIDIFVPSLNKGVEYDGAYFHSFENLKKGKPHWPDEDIHNYHQIKDDYFRSKGIEILHISEKEWLASKEECFQRINQFLGV